MLIVVGSLQGMSKKTFCNIDLPQYVIDQWALADVSSLCSLEKKTWAPWLRKPEKSFYTIVERYPEIQVLMRDQHHNIVASLTSNRIDWDGDPRHLTTWDDVAGELRDYSSTYNSRGNTLCLMSMNVDPLVRGQGVPARMIEQIKARAKERGISHVISSFRPYRYGDFKLKHRNKRIGFIEYCKMTTEDGFPIDPWLRSTTRKGMKFLRIADRSMVIVVNRSEFERYRNTYRPDDWYQITDRRWECGETGSWLISEDGQTATYTEPNVWGEISFI
jgi:GNAT superfamily N-acetyltransferase